MFESDVAAGMRVAFRAHPDGFQAASLGDGRYYHLNCVEMVTGTVIRHHLVPGMIAFCPDGWPADAKHAGFLADVERFVILDADAPVMAGKIT